MRELLERIESGALYHATSPARLDSILSKGIRSGAESVRSGSGPQVGVSTARKFAAVSRGDFGSMVLVLDRKKLGRFELRDVDYWGDDREAEVRVADKSKRETVIPPSAIREIIFLTPGLPRFEVKYISKHGLPISTYWKGKKTSVWSPDDA